MMNTGNLKMLPNTQGKRGILYAQVVISLILRINDICCEISYFFLETPCGCQVIFVHVYETVTNHLNWHSEILLETQGI